MTHRVEWPPRGHQYLPPDNLRDHSDSSNTATLKHHLLPPGIWMVGRRSNYNTLFMYTYIAHVHFETSIVILIIQKLKNSLQKLTAQHVVNQQKTETWWDYVSQDQSLSISGEWWCHPWANYPMSVPDATVYIHTLLSLIQNYMYRSEKRTYSVQDHNVTPNRLKGTCSYNCMHYAQNNRRTLINVCKVCPCNHMGSLRFCNNWMSNRRSICTSCSECKYSGHPGDQYFMSECKYRGHPGDQYFCPLVHVTCRVKTRHILHFWKTMS